ncbi:hypothetical protein ACLBKU_12835 [Erythrobacter sp. NE805]|uniref:hypothetical protein n=1 Tax=Erythrobacter sp. NE805 TaxID=3389875 RepID=UPI00396B2A85
MSALTEEARLNADARASITIGKPAAELRSLWLRPETQAAVWAHFAEVTPRDERKADWLVEGPAGGEYRCSNTHSAGS